MQIKEFFDPVTYTLTYVVYDDASRDAVVIDPVLDYDPGASTSSEDSLRKVVAFCQDQKLTVHFLMETHAHADHLSGAYILRAKHFPNAKIVIGARITAVQELFKDVFNFPEHFATDGRQFDRLLHDNEVVQAGTLEIRVLFTPGHTPACASYVMGDAVFTGDALFMPDYGTGRCDFPAGSARDLFRSVTRRLFTLPEETRVFTGHDYQPNGRPLRWQSTIGDEKRHNIQLNETTTEEQFVTFRSQRDKTLAAPRLLFQSVQVNVAAGQLPTQEDNGTIYLKIPLRHRE